MSSKRERLRARLRGVPAMPVPAPGVPVPAPGVPVPAPGVPVPAPGVPVPAPPALDAIGLVEFGSPAFEVAVVELVTPDVVRIEVREAYAHEPAEWEGRVYVAKEPSSRLLRYLDRVGLAMSSARDRVAHDLEHAQKGYRALLCIHAAHELARGRPATAPPSQTTVLRAQLDVDKNGIVGAAPR